ncbi:hypothetical protein V2G26_000560 [Clonostachys chloroleuca]
MDYNVAFEEPREFLLKYAAESDWPGPGLSCQTSEAAYDNRLRHMKVGLDQWLHPATRMTPLMAHAPHLSLG